MSLGLMMHANWDRMTSGQLQQYKTDRPVYSTPHPVQSTPANNECKLVDLRGADVASFLIHDEEYICLPQVFDLFLKHLVGGLHTVYTKLKRLDITPVVCNVEQVRVLRGLGAIQPGVNRCKLITRKDFESLYRDCTTASRPGRPPKRYSIPSTSDLMSYHNGQQSMNDMRGMMNTPDVRNYHKRMRLDRETNFEQQPDRRLSTSPTRRSPPSSEKYLSRNGAGELYANAANIYLQQALRHQYQQFIANGIHNGVNFQQAADLAPFMSKAGFNGAIPPNLLAQFEEQRKKELRQAFSNENKTASRGIDFQSVSGIEQRHENISTSCSPISQQGDKKTVNSPHSTNSPTRKSHSDDVNTAFSHPERKHTPELENYRQHFFNDNIKTKSQKGMNHEIEQNETNNCGKLSRCVSDDESPRSPTNDSNISSMQTLLSNIQGLLKVAADNAKFQEKQMSFELAELRSRLEKEQELREETERKLEESKRTAASMQRKLDYERETRKRLQEQKLIAQEALSKDKSNEDKRTSPIEQRFHHVHSTDSSNRKSPNLTSSNIHFSNKTASSPESSPMSSSSCLVSPCSMEEFSSSVRRNSRRSVSAENAPSHHRHSSSSPDCTVDSPINMTSEQNGWISCNVAQ